MSECYCKRCGKGYSWTGSEFCSGECKTICILAAELAAEREAVRVLAEEWNRLNHHCSCGNFDNGNTDSSGFDEGDYRHVQIMESTAKAVEANPIASAAVAAAGGKP